ncbi:hypothetical protein [Sulfolobus spindle-shaped virus]|nr:hypothetical protein [Sulfolobus spindle-shaped virus]
MKTFNLLLTYFLLFLPLPSWYYSPLWYYPFRGYFYFLSLFFTFCYHNYNW